MQTTAVSTFAPLLVTNFYNQTNLFWANIQSKISQPQKADATKNHDDALSQSMITSLVNQATEMLNSKEGMRLLIEANPSFLIYFFSSDLSRMDLLFAGLETAEQVKFIGKLGHHLACNVGAYINDSSFSWANCFNLSNKFVLQYPSLSKQDLQDALKHYVAFVLLSLHRVAYSNQNGSVNKFQIFTSYLPIIEDYMHRINNQNLEFDVFDNRYSTPLHIISKFTREQIANAEVANFVNKFINGGVDLNALTSSICCNGDADQYVSLSIPFFVNLVVNDDCSNTGDLIKLLIKSNKLSLNIIEDAVVALITNKYKQKNSDRYWILELLLSQLANDPKWNNFSLKRDNVSAWESERIYSDMSYYYDSYGKREYLFGITATLADFWLALKDRRKDFLDAIVAEQINPQLFIALSQVKPEGFNCMYYLAGNPAACALLAVDQAKPEICKQQSILDSMIYNFTSSKKELHQLCYEDREVRPLAKAIESKNADFILFLIRNPKPFTNEQVNHLIGIAEYMKQNGANVDNLSQFLSERSYWLVYPRLYTVMYQKLTIKPENFAQVTPMSDMNKGPENAPLLKGV